MFELATPNKVLETLAKFNLHLSKRLGQNFLVDQNILKKIVNSADLSKQDVVLEVGAGIGTLTLPLAQKVKRVVTTELDKTLIPALEENLKSEQNVKIIQADILRLGFSHLEKELPRPNKLVSNLPYSIATPLIVRLLEECPFIETYVVMIQREAAQRFIAKPGSKDYGVVALKTTYFAEGKTLFNVSRNVFLPKPKVSSSVINLERLSKPRIKVKDESLLFELVKFAFSKRRKTIKNALLKNYPLIEEALTACRINSQRRPETLSLEEFAYLSDFLSKAGN